MTTHHTFVIAAVELHPGPYTLVIETPAGPMKLPPDHYLVTDADGGQWVFTERQLRAVRVRTENN